MWSFVERKLNKQWIWLALDQDSKEIVGLNVGSRDRTGAKGLWKSLPPVYRQCAVCYTDFWSAYDEIIPEKRHKAVGKDSGKTNHIEAIQPHITTKSLKTGEENPVFFKKIGKPYRGNLEFCPSL